VLAGEQPPRTWSAPVPLRDVVRAAIAETEDLDRVVFSIDDRIAVSGSAVADLTHLLAELTENAVRFSPPDTAVTIRARPDRSDDGGYLLTVEDWGVGMPPDDLAAANELLAYPVEVDLAVAQRLGFHVVSRLAVRHGIAVSLGKTPGSGVTAVVALPAALFSAAPADVEPPIAVGVTDARHGTGQASRREARITQLQPTGWVEPVSAAGAVRTPNGSGRADSPVAPAGQEPNRHGLDGARGGGWRGWWNPESAGAPARHSDREPVDAGRVESAGDAPAEGQTSTDTAQPSPTPRIPEPERADADIPGPRPAEEPPTRNGNGRKPGLRRRVPQAHLAPELRQSSADEPGAAPPPDDGVAASALSRYQASRQAAQAVVDETEAGGTRS
jgi:histidine kinase/DNA gyrase B/HSP90-like ATPase